MRIYGIDASLKSTGICFGDFNFLPEASESILKILLNKMEDVDQNDIQNFCNCVSVFLADEIKSPKQLEKQLAALRKKIRDDTEAGQVCYADLIQEEGLCESRMRIQCDGIIRPYYLYRPNLTLIEDYSFNSQGSIVQLAEMKGYFKCLRDFEVLTAPITIIKRVGSTKGNGNKKQIYEGMQRFPLNVKVEESSDDRTDAIAICLSAFYSIYYRVIGFDFPRGKNSKEKNQIKSWENSLNTFADRIGNIVDMRNLIDGKFV